MAMHHFGVLILAAAALLVPATSRGQSYPHPDPAPGAPHAAQAAHPEGDESHRPNVASVFLGATTETAEDETYFTVGAEYERRLSSRWGFQLAAEYVSDFDAWVVAAPLAIRPVGGLWLGVGPGFQTKPGRAEAEHHGGHEGGVLEEEDGPFFLWRFKAGYGIHFGHKFSAMPNVSFDLVRENGEWAKAWVFGVSFGAHF